jgi:hypothetical protein
MDKYMDISRLLKKPARQKPEINPHKFEPGDLIEMDNGVRLFVLQKIPSKKGIIQYDLTLAINSAKFAIRNISETGMKLVKNAPHGN